MDVDRVGARIGPRIAKLVADASIYTRMRMGPHNTRLAVHAVNEFLEQVSAEHQEHGAELWGKLTESDVAPEWARRVFGFLANGKGQWSALLGHAVVSAGVGTGLYALFNNELADVTGAIIATNPQAKIDPILVAQLVAQRKADRGHGAREAAFQGINGARFDQLVEFFTGSPSPDVAISLFRRGRIDEATMQHAFRDAMLDDRWLAHMEQSTEVRPSPADLADMVVRGILAEPDAARLARAEGMESDHFHRMVLDTGETLGLESLLAAFRRGIIDAARLRHGIAQSRVRTEWTDVIEALRFSPMSTADALRAVVQNHLSDQQGQAIAEQNGLLPAHWRALVETEGRPPGPETMIALWRRGHATEAQVVQAIRESDVKNKYIPLLLAEREHIPPERSVVSMLSHGSITEAVARGWLGQLGFPELAIDGFVKEGHRARTAAHRTFTTSVILELYQDHALSKADASRRLEALGWAAADLPTLLDLAELRREHQETEGAVRVVRSQYVAHHLTDGQAQAELSTLGLASDRKDRLLRLWRLERAGTVRRLTEAQVVAAVRRNQIGRADGLSRLEAMGYSPGDAELLLPAAPAAR